MSALSDPVATTPEEFRAELVAWLAVNEDQVRPPYGGHGSTAELLAHQRSVQALLYDEGFMRCGWPANIGGLGGSPLLRAVLGEELTWRGLVHSAAFSMTEVLGPAVVEFAPALAAVVVPALLRGDELWCQGFSEPEAGSDLGSLRTRATQDGDSWLITGQKLWTSWAHHAARCIVLARTEEGVSGSRGVSAFLVDMNSPGVSTRPLRTMADVDEFCETYFDDVRVPGERLLGPRGAGWAVAQYILACERGPIFWQRGAWLLHHLGQAAGFATGGDDNGARRLGQAYADLFAFRARSRSTQQRLAAGEQLGAESSIDKILIALADQAVFDVSRQVLAGVMEFDDSDTADRFRKEWCYSRAATIYGGTAEIQRDIVGWGLLGLPKGA